MQQGPSIQPSKQHTLEQPTRLKSNVLQQSLTSKKGPAKTTQASLTNWLAPKSSANSSGRSGQRLSLGKKFPLRESSNVPHTKKTQPTGNSKPARSYGAVVPKPVASVSPIQAQKKSK